MSVAKATDADAHAAFVGSSAKPGRKLETTPKKVALRFTEPLNHSLSNAKLIDSKTGKTSRLKTKTAELRITLEPVTPLKKGSYRVVWHTVSTEDGHPLEGSFSFGVRTKALAGTVSLEQSPLARDGWFRILIRTLFYISLFFFAGGVFCAALLSREKGPTSWLVPRSLHSDLAADQAASTRDRAWTWTIDLGWFAAAMAAALAVTETFDAAGNLSFQSINSFLLSNTAGLARVGTVLFVTTSVVAARRSHMLAALTAAFALLTISASGHANSAEPRVIGIAVDWIHLLAGVVWIGGLAQIALAWLPSIKALNHELRLKVIKTVLARFGKVALVAFLAVVLSGTISALIQLGNLSALWQADYGLILLLKLTLVALIALISFWHALRIRPKLLADSASESSTLERRHWRLLATEPAVAALVLTAAAVLVAFPLPPRQLAEAGQAKVSSSSCDPCPQPTAKAQQLAVAEQAGSRTVAFWLRKEGAPLRGEVRLLDKDSKPVNAPLDLIGADQVSCGRGCWRFDDLKAANQIAVSVSEGGRRYRVVVPARWSPSRNSKARRLLERAQATMRSLDSLQEIEQTTSGPGTYARVHYRYQAPNRMSYVSDRGVESVVVDRKQWQRTSGARWMSTEYGGGIGFEFERIFRWTAFAQSVRWLGERREAGRRVVLLAAFEPGTPAWVRLTVDAASLRILKERSIAGAHFIDRRYFAFNRANGIEAPSRSVQ